MFVCWPPKGLFLSPNRCLYLFYTHNVTSLYMYSYSAAYIKPMPTGDCVKAVDNYRLGSRYHSDTRTLELNRSNADGEELSDRFASLWRAECGVSVGRNGCCDMTDWTVQTEFQSRHLVLQTVHVNIATAALPVLHGRIIFIASRLCDINRLAKMRIDVYFHGKFVGFSKDMLLNPALMLPYK